MRVIQTEASTRFVGTASFAAITGAPVLITEWEPDALRGAFPGDPAPEHAPLSHLALVERADLFLIAPASANTIAKLAHGARRQPAHRRRARVPATADRRSGHERCDVRARRDAARTSQTLRDRGVEVLEPGTGALGSPGEWGVGRLPEPAELLAAVEARLGAAARRLARRPARSSSPPAARASRSTPCASSATARRARWAGRWPRRPPRRGAKVTVVAANVVAAARARRSSTSTSPPPPSSAAACARALPGRRRAADGRRRRRLPAGRRRARTRSRRPRRGRRSRSSSSAPTTSSARLAAERRPDQLLVGFAAESGDGALALRARQARAQAPRRRRGQRRLARRASPSTRPTTRSRSSPRTASSTSRRPPRRRSRAQFSTAC